MNPGAKEWTPSFSTPSNPPLGTALPPKEGSLAASQKKKPAKQVTLGLEPPKVQVDMPPPSKGGAKQLVLGGAAPTPAAKQVSLEPTPIKKEVEQPVVKPVAKPIEAPKAKVESVPAPKKAVAVEEEEEEDATAVKEEDPRDHLNVVFIGHVDAGKSSLCGSLLLATGMVDKRTIEKYEKEAKERNRESWYLAYVMDSNEEERAKGKTVEVGTANFETPLKRFTILDAPGHKNYVPAMIAGASHADIGVLVVSSRKGEFESGFEKQGQTREHAMLAFTIGIRQLVVVINKMDDPTVNWDRVRFDEISNKVGPFLKQCGYKVKKDVVIMPIAALPGAGVLRRVTPQECPWAVEIHGGKSLVEILEERQMEGRDPLAPLRISVLDSYPDRGVWAIGKIECGTLVRGQSVVLSPTPTTAKVGSILVDEVSVRTAKPGENVCVRLLGPTEESECRKGFVISQERFGAKKFFTATIKILELLEHRSIFTAGYTGVLHAHTVISECVVSKILWKHDPETGKPIKERCLFAREGDVVTIRIEVPQGIAVEPFDVRPQLGRITIRDEGKSIAVGKVKKIEE